MISRLTSLLRYPFCKNIVKESESLNSIQPKNNNIAYGYYFPQQWSQKKIVSLIDPARQRVKSVRKMKNRVGEWNGKILFQFFDKEAMEKIVLKFNQDYITTKDEVRKVIIKPFQLRTELSKRAKNDFRSKNHVKIKSLNFQTTQNQIRKLAQSYGEVQHIIMLIRPNGLNRGDCSVYFRKRQSAENFIQFIDGFQLQQRKLNASLMDTEAQSNWRKQIEKQFLQLPKNIFAANRQLVIRQSEKKRDFIDTL